MNKTILITGATSGIGQATAVKFASEGWRLILAGRRMDRLDSLSENLKNKYNADILTLTLDVRDQKQVEEMLDALPDNWKDIDVLLNNAGLAVGLHLIHEGVLDDWERMIDTNIKGLLYVTRVVSPWMVKRQQGHIINIGSIAGKEAYLNGNVYCATKFAVDGLSKALRIDLAKDNIRVTHIAPGAVNTEFSLVRFKGDQERADKVYTGFEYLTGDDVADAVYYAASRPAHVNINDLVITPTAQASPSIIHRK